MGWSIHSRWQMISDARQFARLVHKVGLRARHRTSVIVVSVVTAVLRRLVKHSRGDIINIIGSFGVGIGVIFTLMVVAMLSHLTSQTIA